MPTPDPRAAFSELKFRDPARAGAMVDALGRITAGIGRPRVSLMHVCGSHEQAIAKYGLCDLDPGCPQRHDGSGLPGVRDRRP